MKISKHCGERMRERRISIRLLALAIEKGEKIREDNLGDVVRYRLPIAGDGGLSVAGHLHVIVDSGVVVTCYVRGCL